MSVRVYYFGCQGGDAGHYLYDGRALASPNVGAAIPWSRELDGGLCPREDRLFIARVHHRHNWTAIAFWDRTGDERSGSNSVFLIEERVDFERGIQMAEECYPWLFERFAHDIQQEGADGAERL